MGKWYTYILQSKKLNKYYFGSTENLERRVERHNNGWGRYTKAGIPWELVYNEEHQTKTEALTREKEIKNKKSRKYIEEIIKKSVGRPE